jgi:Cd2+/Zn2+-exporting ATPase
MQRTILRNKKLITLISGILVAAAFASHYLLHNGPLAEGLMLAASIIGVLPIALQAYRHRRVGNWQL